MSTRHILPGALELKPLQQGNLSTLCGLYSVLNSIQIALYPQRLTRPELHRINVHAIAYLSRRRHLKRALSFGIEYEMWAELQTELLSYVNNAQGTSLKTNGILTGAAARDRQRAIHRIKKHLRDGSPILAGFGGILDHYSVIAGYTADRLILFDSSGLKWITASKLGLGESSSRAHWILAEQTVAVVDDW